MFKYKEKRHFMFKVLSLKELTTQIDRRYMRSSMMWVHGEITKGLMVYEKKWDKIHWIDVVKCGIAREGELQRKRPETKWWQKLTTTKGKLRVVISVTYKRVNKERKHTVVDGGSLIIESPSLLIDFKY